MLMLLSGDTFKRPCVVWMPLRNRRWACGLRTRTGEPQGGRCLTTCIVRGRSRSRVVVKRSTRGRCQKPVAWARTDERPTLKGAEEIRVEPASLLVYRRQCSRVAEHARKFATLSDRSRKPRQKLTCSKAFLSLWVWLLQSKRSAMDQKGLRALRQSLRRLDNRGYHVHVDSCASSDGF